MARRHRGHHRRLRAEERILEQRAADSAPTAPWAEFVSDGIGLFADVGAWIAAKARGMNIVLMRIVDPPTSKDTPLPPRVARTHVETAAEEHRPVAAAPPTPDPYGFAALSVEQLKALGFNAMPNVERLELERVLNAKIVERRNPHRQRVDPAELERQSAAQQARPWWWRQS